MEKHWWNDYPWRMVQTNLRETDMDGIDAERYAADLADLGATVVTLNAGGILASYESSLPYETVSRFLTGSSLRELVDACHAKGIRVIARMDFSKIPLAVFEQHPDWAFRTADGGILEQNGFVQTCQNSVYQQEKSIEILRELLSTHPFDGVYCNMSGFVATDYNGKVHGFCTCERCRDGFKAAFHMDVPTVMDLKDPVTMRYMGFQMGAGEKLRAKLNAAVKAISPEIAMDKIDYLRSESHSEIGEPTWLYSASSNSRRTAAAGQVSDNACVDFMGFRYRESAVSPALTALRLEQDLANSSALSLYIMGRLDNHTDTASLDVTRRLFAFHRENEQLLLGLRSAAEVLLVVKGQQGRSDPESYGWIRALTQCHVPFDETKSSGIREELLAGKKVVILADAKDLGPAQAALLDAFCEQGGIVVASGDSGVRGNAQSLACLGIEAVIGKKRGLMSTVFRVTDEEKAVFSCCAASPLITPGAEITEARYAPSAKGYLHTLPEPLYGPPEVCYAKEETDTPGAVVNTYGSGKGIFIPWSCGSFYHNEGHANTLNFIRDVLYHLCNLPVLAPGLHESVELVLRRKGNTLTAFLINGSGCFSNNCFAPVPMSDIELRLPGDFVSVRALNGGKAVIADGTVRLDRLNDFEVMILEEK